MVEYTSFSASIRSLYVIGFSNSEQFRLIYLAYAYQVVESGIFDWKYKDNLYVFAPSSVIYKIGSQRFFMRTNFIKISKLRFAL